MLVCKCKSLLEDVMEVAVYNHQPMLERKLLMNIWVFPSQSGWIEATLKRSYDFVVVKKIESGQVNESIFLSLTWMFFTRFFGIKFSLANPNVFLSAIGNFKHPENERKGFQVDVSNKSTFFGILVIQRFPTTTTTKL